MAGRADVVDLKREVIGLMALNVFIIIPMEIIKGQ